MTSKLLITVPYHNFRRNKYCLLVFTSQSVQFSITHPFLVPRSWKSRAIPLPTLWATLGL